MTTTRDRIPGDEGNVRRHGRTCQAISGRTCRASLRCWLQEPVYYTPSLPICRFIQYLTSSGRFSCMRPNDVPLPRTTEAESNADHVETRPHHVGHWISPVKTPQVGQRSLMIPICSPPLPRGRNAPSNFSTSRICRGCTNFEAWNMQTAPCRPTADHMQTRRLQYPDVPTFPHQVKDPIGPAMQMGFYIMGERGEAAIRALLSSTISSSWLTKHRTDYVNGYIYTTLAKRTISFNSRA